MKDFVYYTPTKVYFGKDKHKEVGEIIKSYGYKKIMLQYGKGSIKENGLYDEIMDSLSKNGIEVVEFGGVDPNPRLSFVREAVFVAKESNVEMVLAVGGGSVIDSSKYTAMGAVNDFDVWDIPTRKNTPLKALPVGCILTISAAGSEMSSSAVVTNEELNMKRGYSGEINRCKFAICNPELTYTVSKYQTSCGIVDIMSHTMERYFTVGEDVELTDAISEGLLRTVIKAGEVLMKNPCDYDARATAMWASSLSHNGLTECGKGCYLAVHQLEHALSGEFEHIAHGAGLAVLFPAWARYVYKYNIPRFARFARNVWGICEADDEKAALSGIEKMTEYFKNIEMPSKLREFNIEKESIERLAELCTFSKTREIEGYLKLDFEKVKDIFESCY